MEMTIGVKQSYRMGVDKGLEMAAAHLREKADEIRGVSRSGLSANLNARLFEWAADEIISLALPDDNSNGYN